MDVRSDHKHNQKRGFGRRAGGTRALLLVLPLAAGLAVTDAAPARAAVGGPLAFAGTPLSDRELSALRGGFAFGGFDIAVGVVARSVIHQTLGGAGGVGERLEVVTRFTVPAAGRLAHAGTTVQALDAAIATAPAGDGVSISTRGTTTTVDIGGTTRLTQHMLNTFVENADVGRVITNQLDVNLKIGGIARQLGAVRAARAMRPAIQAQIFYGPR